MTNAAPPGWYPDPWKQAAQRFWDGAQWTHRVTGGGAPVTRPRLPEGAPVYGVIIWVLALLPLAQGIVVWFIHIDVSQLVEFIKEVNAATESGQTVTPDFNPMSIYGAGYWVAVGIGWASYVAAIVLAYFDWRRLGRIGVQRPFQWAWAFLTNPVYVIGRSVIVRRVAAPRGLVPIWIMICAYAAAVISGVIWASLFLGDFLTQLSQALPTA